MEQGTAYLASKLDTLIDRQRDHGEILARLLAAGEAGGTTTKTQAPKRWSFRLRNLPPFWQSIAAGALMWTFAICISAYLKRGGDPMALIELGLKYLL